MRKLLILVLIVAVLCGAVCAYESPKDFSELSLEQAMEEFMAHYQLTENNFCISFYNTVTGESYNFNENKFAMAASTYKLPLNMCFYEMEQEGKIDPNEIFLWTGMTLSEVHRQSILFSNNEVSEAMTGYWNNYYIYKENMRKYSSMPVEEIHPDFYLTNVSCTRLMIDTLKYLYDNSARFEELIGYMKDAVPGQYFKAGVQDYEVAHKYGAINEFVNDVAIIYTPQPILLAVYTQGIYGEGVCAQAARLVTDYTLWQIEHGDAAKIPEKETDPEEDVEVSASTDLTEQELLTETEEPSVEAPVQEGSEEILSQDDTEENAETLLEEALVEEDPEDDEMTPEEALREQQVAAARKKRDAKIVWSVIGVASLMLLVAIPLAMRRRF